jgi:pyruvate/2-oxoglutarate dehydrogenase complex dihydrolipoamide dehydrogenase (E3) component
VTPNDRGPTRTITADVILLATGSQPLRPPSIPFDDPRVFDSEHSWSCDTCRAVFW